jgi:hypothetical protein
MTVPIASSGIRLCRSAHHPRPITAKVRKKPIIDRRLMIDWMLISRSRRMKGPAYAAAAEVIPVASPAKTVTPSGRVP